MRRVSVSLAALALACGGPNPSVDAGDPLDGAARPRVEIGTRASGAIFTPWHDGDSIPLVWGPQGGVMVTPAVAIDGALVSATDPGLDVVISNLTVPDRAPLAEFPGYGPVRSLFARLDTRLVNGPIFDQLGWSPMPGRHVVLRARVSGMGVDAVGEVEIVLVASTSPQPDAGAFDGVDAGVGDAGP